MDHGTAISQSTSTRQKDTQLSISVLVCFAIGTFGARPTHPRLTYPNAAWLLFSGCLGRFSFPVKEIHSLDGHTQSCLDVGHSEAKATEFDRMKTVDVGILYPHEVFAALYHFEGGVLFNSLMTGAPADPQLQKDITSVLSNLFFGMGLKNVLCLDPLTIQLRSCRNIGSTTLTLRKPSMIYGVMMRR